MFVMFLWDCPSELVDVWQILVDMMTTDSGVASDLGGPPCSAAAFFSV